MITASLRKSEPGVSCAISRPLQRELGLRIRKDLAWVIYSGGLCRVDDLTSKRFRDFRVDFMIKGNGHFKKKRDVFILRLGELR